MLIIHPLRMTCTSVSRICHTAGLQLPRQTQAHSSGETKAVWIAQSKAINCLDPADDEAREPEAGFTAGMVNRKARVLPQPSYPMKLRASGKVLVRIVVDAPTGKVTWARAESGPPLLRMPAAMAACQARFYPLNITQAGPPIRVAAHLVYNFPAPRKVKPANSRKRRFSASV